MKITAAFFLALWLWIPPASFAAGNADALLDKAIDHLARHGYSGDTSTAERYLQAVLERQPEHLEANWLVLRLSLARLVNLQLSDRVGGLYMLGPQFTRLAKLAEESNQQAFLHYITAVYASYYKAYDRALSEIDKALALEPRSTRYLNAKAELLIACGSWYGRDDLIEQGIELTEKIQKLAKAQPDRFKRPASYDFQIAWAISELSEPRWKEVVEHYLKYLISAEESLEYAFAWNNASVAYRHLGLCKDARDAAENALKITTFGAAESNKTYAEFCLEMKKLGLEGPLDNTHHRFRH